MYVGQCTIKLSSENLHIGNGNLHYRGEAFLVDVGYSGFV